MRLKESVMYERFKAGDPAFDGRFFTGVKTTGIYCLPSCHAKKPKRENVEFFPSAEAARAAGFRACRKCHPDDFARGADPVLETIEAVAGEVRAGPGRFKDVRAIVRRSGFGTTRTFELFRQHYHCTPAERLLRARLDQTRRELVTSRAPLAEVAAAAGFESLSVLHVHFRERYGMTPAAYRDLAAERAFAVTLPEGYPLAYLHRALSRDRQSVNERWVDGRYEAAVELDGEAVQLTLRFEADGREVRAEISGGSAVTAHGIVIGLLGLEQDAAAFARLARRLGFARLVEGRPHLRVSQTASIFDGLLWAIIGQQINFAFACTLKRRLFERAGRKIPGGLIAPPTPAAVAKLGWDELQPLQYSRQKAQYLTDAARLVADGTLDLEALRQMSATRAERTLLAVRGLGPWSVNYLMMRSLGYADCVPLGDTAITSGLKALFALEIRPDVDDTRRLMAVFSPHRSLATAHLWQLLHEKPVTLNRAGATMPL